MSPNSSQLLTFLLNASWQVPVLALLAMGITRLMRNGPAAFRYWVWVAALISSLLLPAAGSLRTRRSADSVATIHLAPAPVAQNGIALRPAVADQPQRRTLRLTSGFTAAVLTAYALFLAHAFASFVRAWRRATHLRAKSRPVVQMPHSLERIWKRCEEAFGVSGVELRTSPVIAGPATTGKTIVLPESMLAETSEEILLTAIGHEMAHIARRDFTSNMAFELLATPICFHPALRPVVRGIRETRELACDELVTER
jgi:beta-lactamase regulating signal transducer with metallopeptidase domain